MRTALPELFENLGRNTELYGALLVEGAIQPALFWEAADRAREPDDIELKTALGELREHIRHSSDTSHSQGIVALQRLKRLLERSSQWQGPLRLIRLRAGLSKDPQRAELARFLRRFLVGGFAEAKQYLEAARPSIHQLLQTDPGEPTLQDLWRRIEDYVNALEFELKKPRLMKGAIYDAATTVVDGGEVVVAHLNRIGISPEIMMARVMETAQQLLPDTASLEGRVHPDCGLIAVGADEFHDAMYMLLENMRDKAEDCMSLEAVIEFSLRDEATDFVTMTFTQSEPFELPHTSEGGIAEARNLLSRFGAKVQFSRSSAAGEPFLEVAFLAWPDR